MFPVEDERDEISVVDIPPEKRRLLTETYDFSVATIKDYLNKGSMFIPEFQRKYVWNRAQASRLIESLVIQCPIPVIYLSQESDERLSVIDGNQRLTSIRLFLDNEFPLQGLTAYPELEGMFFSDLDSRIQRHMENRTLRCITILKETHPQIKFDVFERINTGAVQLNPQEIRHGIYHGNFADLLDTLSKEKIWKNITGINKDKRMKRSELVLRTIALAENRESYKKPLKRFLNDFCEKNRDIDAKRQLKIKNNFLRSVAVAGFLWDKKAFKLLDKGGKTTGRSVNAALCDAAMVALYESDISLNDVEGSDIKRFEIEYVEMLHEEKFHSRISSATSDPPSIRYRIKRFKKLLTEHFQ